MPHVRMMDEGYSMVENALKFELPYVVIRKVRPYDTATLNYNWQVWETQAIQRLQRVLIEIQLDSPSLAL